MGLHQYVLTCVHQLDWSNVAAQRSTSTHHKVIFTNLSVCPSNCHRNQRKNKYGKRKEKGKAIDIASYSTSSPLSMDHTVLPADYTMPALPSSAFTRWRHPWLKYRTSNSSLLLIYRTWKDERLSWPGWLSMEDSLPISYGSSTEQRNQSSLTSVINITATLSNLITLWAVSIHCILKDASCDLYSSMSLAHWQSYWVQYISLSCGYCYLVSVAYIRDDLFNEVLSLAIRVSACTGRVRLTQRQKLWNAVHCCRTGEHNVMNSKFTHHLHNSKLTNHTADYLCSKLRGQHCTVYFEANSLL